MMKKKLIPTVIASALLSAPITLSVAHANEDTDQKNPSLQQRGDQIKGTMKDAWLDGKLESALLLNEHLNSFAIDTEVRSGVAYLNGVVESDIDSDLAEEIARSIDGVTRVENNLQVDKNRAKSNNDKQVADGGHDFKQAVSNATLTARIKSQLLINSNTSGLSIDVDSDQGKITLSGQVDSEQEKGLAEQIVRNTSGVRSVNNQLTVGKDS